MKETVYEILSPSSASEAEDDAEDEDSTNGTFANGKFVLNEKAPSEASEASDSDCDEESSSFSPNAKSSILLPFLQLHQLHQTATRLASTRANSAAIQSRNALRTARRTRTPTPPLPLHQKDRPSPSAVPYILPSRHFRPKLICVKSTHYPQQLNPSPPLPPSQTTVFLSHPFAASDTTALDYIPYFGDNDNEDVITESYTTEQIRERVKKRGWRGGWEEGKLRWCVRKWCEREEGGGTKPSVGEGMEIFKSIEGVSNIMLANVLREEIERGDNNDMDVVVQEGDVQQDARNKRSPPTTPPPVDPMEATLDPMAAIPFPTQGSNYASFIDSYRNLLCRRCFTYDCNVHGVVHKAPVTVQAKYMLRRSSKVENEADRAGKKAADKRWDKKRETDEFAKGEGGGESNKKAKSEGKVSSKSDAEVHACVSH